jgi:hypothetical protein
MKKTILMLVLFCFAVVSLSAQKEAKPKQKVQPVKQAPSPKVMEEGKQAPAAPTYEMYFENDSYKVYVYYVGKNKPKYIAINKSDCSLREAFPIVEGETANQRIKDRTCDKQAVKCIQLAELGY